MIFLIKLRKGGYPKSNLDLKSGSAMKKKWFVSEQIKAISKRSELTVLVAELIRQVEISEQTCQLNWSMQHHPMR